MSLATCSRSPSIDTKSEAEEISSDEEETTGLLVDHEEVTSSSAEAVVPLRLLGQTDIRRFFKAFDQYKGDEEVANVFGLSLGIHEDVECRPEEQLDILDEEELEDPYKQQENAAIAMGLCLGLDAAPIAEVAFSAPATPPKRKLAAKASMEIEPIQASKRRRMVEEGLADAVKSKQFVQLSEPEVAQVHAH